MTSMMTQWVILAILEREKRGDMFAVFKAMMEVDKTDKDLIEWDGGATRRYGKKSKRTCL